MPRNPSELARLEEEWAELHDMIKDCRMSKSSKEALIRGLRQVERKLGLESKDYNSSEF
jgi:hypothetical protein